MGVIGKGSNSFRKKDVQEQKSVALGFKKIRFAHKATAGDTVINLASMTAPTEMTSNGFTNPNASEIARAQIQLFRNNLKLVSSLRGLLIDQLSYVVSSGTTITFLGFTAEDGEIFQGWLDEAPTTSLSAVDGKTIVASGILAAGSTDFNIGMPIPLNQNPAQQIGAVLVFADRGLQYRKVGNIVSGDGDFYEVPVAGGLGTLLRFNASGSDRFITVVSNGVVAERPDGSMTAMIERTQGQIDAMVPTLAALAGVPTTTFQTAPNDVDLKQFGDQVTTLAATQVVDEARISTLETQIGYVALVTGSATVPYTADTPIKVTGTVADATGSLNISTGRFTALKAGFYDVGIALNTDAASTTQFYIAVNGTKICLLSWCNSVGLVSGRNTVNVNVGDIIDVRSAANFNNIGDSGKHTLSFEYRR